MAKFEMCQFMCRVPRPVRIYKNVYDTQTPSGAIPANTIFKSSKQYRQTKSEMYYIDDGEFAGNWCPAQMVQAIPVEVETPEELPKEAPADATLLKGKQVRIKGSRPVVYKSFDGDATVPNGLKLGDELEVDYARTTVLNGELQFRYHISGVTSEDDTLANYWLLQNGSVHIKQVEGIADEGELVEMVRPFAEAANRPMMTRAAVPPEYYIPGENMPDINEEAFNLFDHIPATWKSVIPENWMDYMPDGWKIPERWKTDFPKDWIKDIPMDWMDNIPDSWKNLKWPELPEDLNGFLPKNWRELYPELEKEITKWRDGVPSNWYELLPKDVQSKIPAELKNLKFPDLNNIKNSDIGQLGSNAANWIAGQASTVISTIAGLNLSLPWGHDSSEAIDKAVDNIDYSTFEAAAMVFEDQHEAYLASNPDTNLVGYSIGRMLFAHGMPFQFTGITDRRNGSTAAGPVVSETEIIEKGQSGNSDIYGRSFAKEIAANIPVCTIVPGKPKFLTNIKDGLGGKILHNFFKPTSSRQTVANAMATTLATGTFEDFASQFSDSDLSGDYEYYSLEIDTTTYFEYVNTLCHTSARMMGIAGLKYQGTPIGNFDWGKYNQTGEYQDGDMFANVTGLDGGVAFTFDPLKGGISDQINTQTTESAVASTLNGYSSKARELEFLLGYSGVDVSGLIDSTNFTESALGSETNTSGDSNVVKAVKRIGSWLKNSVHGMNIKFPEIWSNSEHERSYEIEMHFVTPYATSFCKWRYVLVPFFHAFALAAPRSDVNVSQYRSPFLIRAFSKGYFNVEMGMIESLSWTRYGDGSMISEDGVPLQIDVTLHFKDLYHVLTMTNMYRKDGENGESAFGNNVSNFFNNTGLIDMIGTLSGVDVNRINLADRIQLMAASTADAYASKPTNYMRRISESMRRFAEGFYGF